MSTQPRMASSPFNGNDADIIIRTSDGTDFHVHKFILGRASSVFRDMFTLPTSSMSLTTRQDDQTEIPCVSVEEHSDTWDTLLRFCYPDTFQLIDDIAHVWPLLEASKKYQMEGIHEQMKQVLLSTRFLEAEPLRVYALACHYKFDKGARVAARFTLRRPINGPYMKELECTTAGTYHQLLEYRYACGEAASAIANVGADKWLEWIGPKSNHEDFNFTWFNCRKCALSSSRHGLWQGRYWVDYMERARDALKTQPHGAIVSAPSLIDPAVRTASRCKTCVLLISTDMIRFAKIFEQEVEKVISEVVLTLEG
ncbi:hypothetical protein AcV5_009864 [Taiwanofungus camphoratus]|nr:hypothetical protein AcV5_009864 [Antrodia cinnamomea]